MKGTQGTQRTWTDLEIIPFEEVAERLISGKAVLENFTFKKGMAFIKRPKYQSSKV